MTRAAIFAVLSCLLAQGAVAAGAIAVGEPSDVAKDGLAVGIAVDRETETKARDDALALCRSYRDAPQATRDLCKVIKSFASMCVSTAYDPEPSTPGWGYGVGFTKFTSEDEAMQMCRTSAGMDRARYCKAATTICDTK